MAGPYTGDVTFTILDGEGASFSGPANQVMCLVGCCIGGTVNTVVATRDPATLVSNLNYGPLTEAAGLVLAAGGVVLAVKTPTATAGYIVGSANATTAISGVAIVSTNARITYSAQAQPLITGDVVTIAAVGGSVEVNGTWTITVIDTTHFEIDVITITPYASGGTVQFTGAVATMAAPVVAHESPYFTGAANDTYYPMVVAQKGFTVGTTGGTVLISIDAGRTFGPPIAVGTATTIALKDVGGLDTGLTLHLGTSGQVWTGGGISNGAPIGDYVRASTVEPQPSDAGIQSAFGAIAAYLAGQDANFLLVEVVGSMLGASDATAIQSGGSNNMASLASQYIFLRAIMASRDAHNPTAWGGAGETESTWQNAVLLDFGSTLASRVCASAGYYNMPSAFSTSFASSPVYRRPFSFALAAREVAIQVQTHPGKIGQPFGGALSQIEVLPSYKTDGFVYHDENLNPAFDYKLVGGVGRMASARSHFRRQGFFAADPITLNAFGSDFTFLFLCMVMDFACTVTRDALLQFVDADVTVNANGTLTDAAASTVQAAVDNSLNQTMLAVSMISGFTVTVNQTINLLVNASIGVTVSITAKGYVLEEDVTIGFSNGLNIIQAA